MRVATSSHGLTAKRSSFVLLALAVGVAFAAIFNYGRSTRIAPEPHSLDYQPRKNFDIGGYEEVQRMVGPWDPTSLADCSAAWRHIGFRLIQRIDAALEHLDPDDPQRIPLHIKKASLFNYEGKPRKGYEILEQLRTRIESNDDLSEEWLFTVIFFQGLTALRRGEDENCILCRGESSCIFPIAQTAVHRNPVGSRLAVRHFNEYLGQFPNDRDVQWLLHLAYMTLGEDVGKVAPKSVLPLDHFVRSEFDIGRFRDIGHLVGVSRLNCAGGAIMEDFDNDGLLDIVVTTIDPTQRMAYYRNQGNGRFEELTDKAGLTQQLGGMYCVQGDFNNDGHMDIFIVRGAWFQHALRPTLLQNNGNGTFTDVTNEAGLCQPGNSIAVSWTDYDNDGYLDMFVCGDRMPNRLFRNKGNGTFEDVAKRAGVQGDGQRCFGSAWLDFDNDGFPDLFLNHFTGSAQLFHNNRDGTFSDVTHAMGITGPEYAGFSCWTFDFDNDGWLDIFATCYYYPLGEVVDGLGGMTRDTRTCKLFRNRQTKQFDDVTCEVRLNGVYGTMGSNFGDFDNDGYLDMYLGTGGPSLASLIPNRMFRNVYGKRFAEITASSRTGHLQKGHGIACGDWNRDGNIDIFIEMGGAIPGDRYHNVLFQNPGQGNNWLTVKLIGQKTNRAAIGARIKVLTHERAPLTVHRVVSSGSSFGANPLQQTIGLGKAERVASLEIFWPTSHTTQVFRDIAVNQAIEVREFAAAYRKLEWKPMPVPD